MNQKSVGTLYIIIGAAGIIGSMFAVFLLILTAATAGTFYSYAPPTDPDYETLKRAGDTAMGFAVLGIAWVACIIVTSIVTILSGVRKFRK